jgi:hypothetical protein
MLPAICDVNSYEVSKVSAPAMALCIHPVGAMQESAVPEAIAIRAPEAL